jgi:hypothetical protein
VLDPGGLIVVQSTPKALAELFESDETAWLEQTAELVRDKRFDQLDISNLAEYLTDMARRDRREVVSRLVALLAHLLKWEHQPERRGGSWRSTILEQQRELRVILESGTLRNHAESMFEKAYAGARRQAAAEIEQEESVLPKECPWTLDGVIGEEPGSAEPN